MAFAPGYRDPDVYTAQVYAMAMGGGMSSAPVPEDPRRTGPVLFDLRPVGPYDDTGQITVYAGTSADEIADLTRLTVDELKRAADDMTEAEVRAPRPR
jgi:predicted Zn-dependent peptidase